MDPSTALTSAAPAVRRWFDETFVELVRQFRWSYLPPLMVYLAAGVAGLTGVVGTFFVKDYLGLSAAFLASLTFWSGIPWALKMPLGHLVDLIWRWKAVLVWLGAGLLALSFSTMYALIAHTETMTAVMAAESWFIIAALLAPAGYVVQDVVADAMTVEAVPLHDDSGQRFSEAEHKAMHTTMQTLGRFAIIGGTVGVAVVNIFLFRDAALLTDAQTAAIYADVYRAAMIVPVISVAGVVLGGILMRRRASALDKREVDAQEIDRALFAAPEDTRPNWWILGGGGAFVLFSLGVGIGRVPFAQEITFAGSLAVVIFLIHRLLLELDPALRGPLVGTAVIIFVFRAMPPPGAGATWFQIDMLGFDQQFIAVLSLITSVLALAGLVVLRPLMARRSIAWIVVLLSIAGGVLALPNIGLYYGIHEWTAQWTAGIVDARFIAIIDTAIESPLGQVAMIPMLAWIARNAPAHLKATFFAVMASFTNLGFSASYLLSGYVNRFFVVSREITDPTGAITVQADYSELGLLLITVALLSVVVPLAVIAVIQHSRLRTEQ